MEFISQLLLTTAGQVVHTFSSNWPFLLASILVATLLKLYLNPEQVSAFLLRYQKVGVVAATTAAVATPLCSCGTTAVILGMMAGSMPWAPIVAFMVASPLTSPQELVYSAGLFGWPFAWAFFISSILLGLAGGIVAALAESRGWLAGQSRIRYSSPTSECSCGQASEPAPKPRVTARDFVSQAFQTGKMLLVMFFGFASIGYLLNGLIPPAWIAAVFGSGNAYSVPLAATLGLPLYVNTEGSLPLVRALIDAGMSPGAALAFLISGAGTSFGAVAGALTIARWRVIGLVVGTLWVGAIFFGMVYNLIG